MADVRDAMLEHNHAIGHGGVFVTRFNLLRLLLAIQSQLSIPSHLLWHCDFNANVHLSVNILFPELIVDAQCWGI